MSLPFARGAKSPSPLFVSQASTQANPIKMEDDLLRFRSAQATPVPTPVIQTRPGTASTPVQERQCSEEQRRVIEIALSGQNIFVHGEAGSGKSYIIQQVSKELRARGRTVRIVAPTGLAASLINGTTYHSYCSWTSNFNRKSINRLEEEAQYGWAQARFDDTDSLIIDEISTISNLTLERINRAMRMGRDKEHLPFGGVQILVFGDFCQLAPIEPFATCFKCGSFTKKKWEGRRVFYRCLDCKTQEAEDTQWAFSSQVWEEADFIKIHLTENRRQGEAAFVRFLRSMRNGETPLPADYRLLHNHESDTEGATHIFLRRADVKEFNDGQLAKINQPTFTYTCLDYFRPSTLHPEFDSRGDRYIDGILKTLGIQHPYEKHLELKLGTPVLLITNISIQDGLVNGSHGRIIGFEDYDPARIRKSKSGIDRGTPASLPGHNEEQGHEHESYMPIRGGENAVIRHEQVLEFMRLTEPGSRKWPIVRFSNDREMTIFADTRLEELGNEAPYALEGRTQIPLIPMWAITLYKAQGMSLDKVVVDLKGRFAPAQTYVALSRARTLRGLTVKNLVDAGRKSEVYPEVKAFLRNTRWDYGRLP